MTTFLSDEDQERLLDKGLKKIKAQSFHIHTSISSSMFKRDTFNVSRITSQ